MKRYIASDFHVRNEISDYTRIMDFLSLVESDADEFLLLGDWLELLWSNINIISTEAPYRYVFEKVRSMGNNVQVKIVTGNHDWNLTFFKSLLEPAQVIEPFQEDGVYFCHGHTFDWVSLITGTPVDPIYWDTFWPFCMPPALAHMIISRANEKWGKSEDRYFWGVALIHERAAAYARGKGYHTVVFGHTHYPSVELRGGINLYNCGDGQGSYSYLVQKDGVINLNYY